MRHASYEVVHSLAGRVRVRFEAIRCDWPLARGLEDLISHQVGVQSVRVNADCASVAVTFNPEVFSPLSWLDKLQIDQITPRATRGDGVRKLPPVLARLRRASFSLEARLPPKTQFVLGVVSLAVNLIEAPVFITRIVLSASLVPIVNRAIQTFLDERRLGADALDSVTCTLLIKEGGFGPAALMMFFIASGELIRDLITIECQHLFAHQLALSQHSAWLMKGHKRTRVPVAELKADDRLVVYPGEVIGFAGVIEDGEGTVVPASPEMDFEPKQVHAGDWVAPDTLLTDGKLFVLYYEQCSLKKADPVREKQSRRWLQRTKLHRSALRRAYGNVGTLLSLAALTLVVTRSIHQAVTIICYDFLTGIKIAIPIAVLSSMYKAGSRGIVIRNAGALERLSEIDAVIFARGGTLTAATPSVTEVFVAENFSLEQMMRSAAAVEQRYNHLAAYAIYRYVNLHTIPVPERTTSSFISGLGVTGKVEGHDVVVGSTRLMKQKEIDLSCAQAFLDGCKQRGDARACVAIDGKLAGVIAYQDPLREEAPAVVSELRRLGIAEIAMTSGGSQATAEALAARAGIFQVHGRTLPEDQAAIVREYKRRGLKVAVVGYDVGDSLALEQADIAVTLNNSTDVARYRSDVVLTSENLTGLVEGIEIARQGMGLARENLVAVSVPNWLGLGLSVFSEAEFFAATILNNGSVIVAAVNGLRPLLDSSAEA